MAKKAMAAAPGTNVRGGKGAVSSTFTPTFGAGRSASKRTAKKSTGRAMSSGRSSR